MGWVILLKDKKNITITNGFQTILNEPGHKQSQIWADKSCKFYSRSMKSDQSKVSTLKSLRKGLFDFLFKIYKRKSSTLIFFFKICSGKLNTF